MGARRWGWFLLALGLLLLADPLTTIWAISLVGRGSERNPIMRWLVVQGPMAILIVHVVVGGIAILGFDRVVRVGDHLSEVTARRYRTLTDVWIGALVVVGSVVVANNVAVILAA